MLIEATNQKSGGILVLNSKQKEEIRNIRIYRYATAEKDGKPIDRQGKLFVIPSFSQIKEEVVKEIIGKVFSSVKPVKPSEANCIIRVFKLLHNQYDGMTFNIYGAHCYTRKAGKWFANSDGGEFQIDYSKFQVKHWFFQDEYAEFDFDFFDCYVKVC